MKISHRVKKLRSNVVQIGNRIDSLEEKREDKIEELQEMCHHEFISEYGRGGSHDWEGSRICEICCLEEEHGSTGYHILNTDRVRKINLDQLCDLKYMRTDI